MICMSFLILFLALRAARCYTPSSICASQDSGMPSLAKQLWLCFPSISCSPRCWWKERCLTGRWNGSKSTLFLTSTASTSLYRRKPSPVLSLIFLRNRPIWYTAEAHYRRSLHARQHYQLFPKSQSGRAISVSCAALQSLYGLLNRSSARCSTRNPILHPSALGSWSKFRHLLLLFLVARANTRWSVSHDQCVF